MNDSHYEIIIKVVIVGESFVGKTNLLMRYADDKFNPNQKSTLGMDFLSKDLVINHHSLKVQFWDTAGQEKYKAISSSYYKVSSAVILVYDISRRDSFDRLENWIQDVQKYTNKNLKMMLIGNKIDLESERQVMTDEGANFAQKQGMYFWETSAKSNVNKCVNKAFETVIEECMNEALKSEAENESSHIENIRRKTLKKVDKRNEKKESCC